MTKYELDTLKAAYRIAKREKDKLLKRQDKFTDEVMLVALAFGKISGSIANLLGGAIYD